MSSFVSGRSLAEYYAERSDEALAAVRSLTQDGGVVVQEHREVGAPAEVIADVARREGCDLIVMGTRGLGSRAGVWLGSVAQSTVERTSVPVLLVK